LSASTVTEFVDTVERLPEESTAYALYVPETRPVAASEVSVFVALIVTEFQEFPEAPVMLARFVTVTVVFTRYAVPVSVLLTVTLWAGLTVSAPRVTVGAVTSSTVMVELAVAVTAGPWLLDVSRAPLAAKTGMTVPGSHPDTVTVRDEPESVPGLKVHPVAEPAFEKSPDATPVTDSENVSVYVNDVAEVGDDCDELNDDTVGGARSRTVENLTSPELPPCDSYHVPAAQSLLSNNASDRVRPTDRPTPFVPDLDCDTVVQSAPVHFRTPGE